MMSRADRRHGTARRGRIARVRRLAAMLRLALALLPATACAASPVVGPADSFVVPAWAYPSDTPGPTAVAVAGAADSAAPLEVPNSDRRYTRAGLANRFDAPDWHPDRHPPMPEVVAKGRAPEVYACGYCHLPDGQGRVENAPVAGLPADYIMAQVRAIRSGERRSAWSSPQVPAEAMHAVAMAVSEEDLKAAATYFSRVPLTRRALVTEAERIPQMRMAAWIYLAMPQAGSESLGERIVEVADDQERHELRDAAVPYRAYVPPGSIDAGRRLAAGDAGAGRPACETCHGADFRGTRIAPPIAGRSPTYLLRQLIAFRTGSRAGIAGAPMQPVAATLSLADMIRVAGYAASLPP